MNSNNNCAEEVDDSKDSIGISQRWLFVQVMYGTKQKVQTKGANSCMQAEQIVRKFGEKSLDRDPRRNTSLSVGGLYLESPPGHSKGAFTRPGNRMFQFFWKQKRWRLVWTVVN